MLTDKEKLIDAFDSMGLIEYILGSFLEMQTVSLAVPRPGRRRDVYGYYGLQATFNFDVNGKFLSLEIGE